MTVKLSWCLAPIMEHTSGSHYRSKTTAPDVAVPVMVGSPSRFPYNIVRTRMPKFDAASTEILGSCECPLWGALAVMNNACKSSEHAWCAPSIRHHMKTG